MTGPDDYFDRPPDKRMARAIADGDVATAEQLIRNGQVQPLTVGRDQINWLIIAIISQQRGGIEKLLQLGALGPPRGPIAGQALYTATIQDDLVWLKQLHAAGADLNNYGGGDLLLATAMNTQNRATLDFYLAHGADINMPTNVEGSVALTAAIEHHFDLANELLDRGASPWIMDKLGTTLGYAAEHAAQVPSWDQRSQMNRERLVLLQRLHAIGLADPAPSPDQGCALRTKGAWPPANAPRAAPRVPAS